MRAVLQRVDRAVVFVEGREHAAIGRGLLVYLGIHREDTEKDSDWMIYKILQARIFADESGKMAKSILEVRGELMIVSQITLYGDLLKGNRPDMILNMKLPEAKSFYELFLEKLKASCPLKIHSGVFGADMDILSTNDGPITLVIDSSSKQLSRQN
ncbi:MAG: D-aminoacyl-tRNA deacylase [Candidatus Omnitrophica bacterium]|nr:D-aminoacyl-tRNA deacylase [Candidatus Omnitrophota bacterium]